MRQIPKTVTNNQLLHNICLHRHTIRSYSIRDMGNIRESVHWRTLTFHILSASDSGDISFISTINFRQIIVFYHPPAPQYKHISSPCDNHKGFATLNPTHHLMGTVPIWNIPYHQHHPGRHNNPSVSHAHPSFDVVDNLTRIFQCISFIFTISTLRFSTPPSKHQPIDNHMITPPLQKWQLLKQL